MLNFLTSQTKTTEQITNQPSDKSQGIMMSRNSSPPTNRSEGEQVPGKVHDNQEELMEEFPGSTENQEDNQKMKWGENQEDVFVANPPNYHRKSMIQEAGEHLDKRSGFLFKPMTHFFADRKFITIAYVHLAITMVIFSKYYS